MRVQVHYSRHQQRSHEVCYKVSSQPGKWLTFYQVAEWSNSLTFGVVGRTSHGFDSGPVHILWFLIRKGRKEKDLCVKEEKHSCM